MLRLGQGWRARLLVTFAGAVAALGFAPFHIWPATLLALVILYARLCEVATFARAARVALGTGVFFGLGWFSASCFWIASAFVERGPSFIPLIPPMVGGLAVVLSLFWGVAGAGFVALTRNGPVGVRPGWIRPLAFAGCFGLAELARGHLFSGFPWNMAGYAFEPGGWVSQSAWLFGIYGLTLVIHLIAGLVGEAWRSRRLVPGLAGLGVLGALFAYGGLRLSGAPAADRMEVQPGIVMRLVTVPFRQRDKIDPVTSVEIVRAYIAESVQPGLEDVTHLVWPEGAVNGLAIEDYDLLAFMGQALVQADDTPPVWLMSSLRLEVSPDPKTGEPRPRYYNSAVAVTFDADGYPAVAATNDKRKLVPFGEFIPGGEIVESLGARLVSTALGSITGAPQKRTANFPGLPPISAQICYEVIFPGLTPRGGADGQDDPAFILNQSNDAWFGGTVGPDQHAAIARYRAIEEGLPLVRSAANGWSGVFDAYGRTVADLAAIRVSHIDATIPKPLKRMVPNRLVNFCIGLISLCLVLISGTVRRA